jgi:hypothetical protein
MALRPGWAQGHVTYVRYVMRYYASLESVEQFRSRGSILPIHVPFARWLRFGLTATPRSSTGSSCSPHGTAEAGSLSFARKCQGTHPSGLSSRASSFAIHSPSLGYEANQDGHTRSPHHVHDARTSRPSGGSAAPRLRGQASRSAC